MDSGDKVVNERLFDELHADAAAIEASVGFALEWERLGEKRACRIARYLSYDVDDEAGRPAAQAWATTTLISLYSTLNDRLRSRAKTIRDETRAAREREITLAHDAGAAPDETA